MTDHRVQITIRLRDLNWTVCAIVDAFARPKCDDAPKDIKIEVAKGDTRIAGSDLDRVRNDLTEEPSYADIRYRLAEVELVLISYYGDPRLQISGADLNTTNSYAERLRGLLADHLSDDQDSDIPDAVESEPAPSPASAPQIERILRPSKVIVTDEDLRALSALLTELINQHPHQISVICEITDHEGSTYKGDQSLLSQVSSIARQPVHQIRILGMSSSDYTSAFHIVLTHGESAPYVRLQSTNPHWLNAAYQALSDYFRSLQPQRTIALWQRIFGGMLVYTCIYGLAIAIVWRIYDAGSHSILASGHHKTVQDSWVTTAIIVTTIVGGVLAWVAIFAVSSWVSRTFPGVELQIGRPHMMKERKRRQAAAWLIGVVVVPVLLTMVSIFA